MTEAPYVYPGTIALAKLSDGTRVAARGSIYMRSIVCLRGVPEDTFVRSHRWTRYRAQEDGRTRMTGRGVAA